MANITEASTLHRDPTIWRPPLFDREERWNYPSVVHNTLKEVIDVSNTTAGNSVIPTAAFMSDKIVFSGTASGTKTVPTATSIVTYLESVYSQVIGRVSASPDSYAKEIEVEFFNTSANPITLAQNTGVTMYPNNLVIPAASNATYKFVIEQTTPTPTINAYLVPGVAGYANTLLPILPAAPDQVVVYDPLTNTYGYVTNATLSTTIDTNTDLIGWDTATSTIRRIDVTTGAPQQLVTRNATTGAYVVADTFATGDFGSGNPIQITAGGIIQLQGQAVPNNRYKDADQVVNDGTEAIVTYPAVQATPGTGLDVTYAGGVFTLTRARSYTVSINFSMTSVAAGSYLTMYMGTDLTGLAVSKIGPFDSQQMATMTVPINTSNQGGQFVIGFSNASGGPITISGAAAPAGYVNQVMCMVVE